MLSTFYNSAPVTQYSPAVIDVSANLTKVRPSIGLYTLRPEYERVLSSGVRTLAL